MYIHIFMWLHIYIYKFKYWNTQIVNVQSEAFWQMHTLRTPTTKIVNISDTPESFLLSSPVRGWFLSQCIRFACSYNFKGVKELRWFWTALGNKICMICMINHEERNRVERFRSYSWTDQKKVQKGFGYYSKKSECALMDSKNWQNGDEMKVAFKICFTMICKMNQNRREINSSKIRI